MRKFLSIFATSLVATLVLAGAALAQEDESGFAFPSLVDGETVEADFEESTMQLYTFIGSEGDEVTISMESTGDNEVDTLLVLLGANGEVVAYNDDIDTDGGDYNSMIEEVELPADGLYVVVATLLEELHAQNASEDEPFEDTSYELTAEGFSEPAEMTEETDNLFGFFVEAEDGVVEIAGDITLEEGLPIAYIFFFAEEGQTINFTTAESETDNAMADPLMYLFNADGARVVAMDDAEEGDFFPAFEYEATEDGLYLAFVTGFGFPLAADEDSEYEGYGDVFVELVVE